MNTGALLGSISVGNKFRRMVGITLLGMAVLMIIAMLALKANLLEDRKVKIRHLVESTHGMLVHFHQLAQRGAMTESEAQNATAATVESLRYEVKDHLLSWLSR